MALSPRLRLLQGDDFSIDDEEGAPCGDASEFEIVVARDLELRRERPASRRVVAFLREDVVAEAGLAVFEAEGDVVPRARAPEEREIISEALANFESLRRAVRHAGAFEINALVGGASHRLRVGEKREFLFAELVGVVEGERKRLGFFQFDRGRRHGLATRDGKHKGYQN